MALLTAQGIANVAVALLYRSLVLPRTVTMVGGDEFAGDNGDTITVRVSQPGAARTEAPGTSLTAEASTEVPVDVTLGHLYNLKNVNDAQLSLELADFARQITAVQVGAVAVGAENKIAGALNNLSVAPIELAGTASAADTEAIVLQARETLGEADVPASDRFLAVSPSIATRLLAVDKFTRVNESGSPSALRDAILGRIYGFTVVESNGLTTDTAYAYHKSGLAFAMRTPVNPRGATESAAISHEGIGMRQVFQYNASIASDQSLVSTFAGCSAVADEASPDSESYPRIVKIGVGS